MTTLFFEAVFIGTEYSRQGADGLSGNTPQGMRRSADFQNIQVPGTGTQPVFRIRDIWVRIRIQEAQNHTDPDPAQNLSTVVDIFFLLVRLVKFFAYRTVSTTGYLQY